MSSETFEKLKKQAYKLILIALGDPSISHIKKEIEKFNELWEEIYPHEIK